MVLDIELQLGYVRNLCEANIGHLQNVAKARKISLN
jgi:hypothetical protein